MNPTEAHTEHSPWSAEAAQDKKKQELARAFEFESAEARQQGVDFLRQQYVDSGSYEGNEAVIEKVLSHIGAVDAVDIESARRSVVLPRSNGEPDGGWFKIADAVRKNGNGDYLDYGFYMKQDSEGRVMIKPVQNEVVERLTSERAAAQAAQRVSAIAERPLPPAPAGEVDAYDPDALENMRYTPEISRHEAQQDLGEQAVEQVVPQPEMSEADRLNTQIHDAQAELRAMSAEQQQELIAARRSGGSEQEVAAEWKLPLDSQKRYIRQLVNRRQRLG